MFGKLILRNIRRRPWQQGLTLFVVAACTAALVTGILLVWGIERAGQGAVDNLGADVMAIPADAHFEPGQILFTGAPANIYMDAKVLEEIEKIPGIEGITAQFFSQTLNQSCCSLPEEYRLVGYDPQTDFLVRNLLAKGVGRDLKETEVIVGGNVPAFLGDRVVILAEAFDVAGYLKPLGGSIDDTIFVPITTARRLAGASPYLQEYWQEAGDPEGLISSVLIKTASGIDSGQVARDIDRILGIKGVTASNLFAEMKEELLVIKEILRLMVVINCGITIASLSSRYSSLVLERQQELALLRALGTEKKNIFKLVMLETLCSSVAAAFIGCLAGYGLVLYLAKSLSSHSSFPFMLPMASQLGIAFAGVVAFILFISCLAAFWPARSSSRLDPVIALTEGEL
ncbi:ABC-type transport system, involved in lipoprotein release, permease component [Desulfitobacterium dichloroeliminans LMG P-21439]|uniref:ABC-type transport system, involved in lipoprotein release, permease component n=1 Tax=Desulfitobacterium dichloroeliminans (strain LMG P-21439 / DCA1) TaxID=871963 RepID=L0F456_DESDL|nr:FtsX-like permease family protein [Desulfitobacterium dichloroeliminans]AGA67718.1 ABC-type transport system, involved in lipoprotein release, permease component [Desulfitobacterium dichloroeliminans LMG P-21439]